MTQAKEHLISENTPCHNDDCKPTRGEETKEEFDHDVVCAEVDPLYTEGNISATTSTDNVGAEKRSPLRPRKLPVTPRTIPLHQVRVHVYDLFDQDCIADMGIAKLNLGRTLSSLNDTTLENMEMGFFHAGVEVCDVEYSFGYCEYGTGVYSCIPRGSPGYTFRCTIDMPHTTMDRLQIEKAIRKLAREWQGHKYSVIERNCCDFTNEVCVVLGVGACPAWVNALANSFVPLARGAREVSKIPTQISTSTRSIAWKPIPIKVSKISEREVSSPATLNTREERNDREDRTTTMSGDGTTSTLQPSQHMRQLSTNASPGPISKLKELTNSWSMEEVSSCFFCYQDDFEEAGLDDSVHSGKSCAV